MRDFVVIHAAIRAAANAVVIQLIDPVVVNKAVIKIARSRAGPESYTGRSPFFIPVLRERRTGDPVEGDFHATVTSRFQEKAAAVVIRLCRSWSCTRAVEVYKPI